MSLGCTSCDLSVVSDLTTVCMPCWFLLLLFDFDSMDGKITKKEMLRRSSCLSRSPGYKSLENLHVNLRQIFLLG